MAEDRAGEGSWLSMPCRDSSAGPPTVICGQRAQTPFPATAPAPATPDMAVITEAAIASVAPACALPHGCTCYSRHPAGIGREKATESVWNASSAAA